MMKITAFIRLLALLGLLLLSGMVKAETIDLECMETEYPLGGAKPPDGKYYPVTISEEQGLVSMRSGTFRLQINSPNQFAWILADTSSVSLNQLWLIDRRTGRFTVEGYSAGVYPMSPSIGPPYMRGVCNRAVNARKF